MSGPGYLPQPDLIMPLPKWPEGDQAAWHRATEWVDGPFGGMGGGKTPAPLTLRSRITSYGRWLAFLKEAEILEIDDLPTSRVTPERLDAFIASMQARGNKPVTIIGRMVGLHGALKMLAPNGDHRWVLRPRGIPIQSYFTVVPRSRSVHHSTTLLVWAEKLFAAGLAHPKPRCRRALIRDAAIVAVLVLPAPRVGALTQVRLGVHLMRREESWCLDQETDIIKLGLQSWSPLHPAVTLIIDRYLAVFADYCGELVA